MFGVCDVMFFIVVNDQWFVKGIVVLCNVHVGEYKCLNDVTCMFLVGFCWCGCL